MQPKLTWYLIGDKGGRSERRALLEGEGTFNIGRHDSNDIVLADEGAMEVSRFHAQISFEKRGVVLTDLESSNGTYLEGERINQAMWRPGEMVEIGPYVFELEDARARKAPRPAQRTPEGEDEEEPKPAYFRDAKVSTSELARSGRIVAEVEYLALGGGLGSFCWVDHLRVFGVPVEQVRAIGVNEKPYGKYKQLCQYSQIPLHERLRSNSISTPDNVWGFPGYASREAWAGLKRGRFGSLKHLFEVFGEPALAISYTPRAGQVFDSLDREGRRIGWERILAWGNIEQIRMTDDDRYVVAYRGKGEGGRRAKDASYMIGRYLHLATGYPGSQFLPELQKFKQAHRDSKRVFNAYEPPLDRYDDLARNGGTVVVRGRGIVASRVIQKLYELRRDHGADIQVRHLMRSAAKPAKYDLARRFVLHNVEIQPFNWPKSCWSGTLRKVLEDATPEGRAMLIRQWGGTTTAERSDWDQLISDGQREGWYKIIFGNVRKEDGIKLIEDGRKVRTVIDTTGKELGTINLDADYIIDCTGLISDLRRRPFLRDLIDTYGLARNKTSEGRVTGLAVTNDFEIEGLRNGRGRAYAAGVMTVNGPYAAVDSFLGLQYAALRAVDHLHSIRAPYIAGMGPVRSFGQWLKWCANSQP